MPGCAGCPVRTARTAHPIRYSTVYLLHMRACCIGQRCFLPAPARPHAPSEPDRAAGRQSSSWRPYLTTVSLTVTPLHFLAFQTARNATLTRVTAPCVPRRHASRSSSAPESRVALRYSVSPVLHSPPVIAQARRGVSIEPLRRPPPSASACTLTASPCCEPSGAGWPVGRVEWRGPGRWLGWPRGRPAD